MILFAAGGTAGHVNPALEIAAKLEQRLDAAEIHFVGTPKGIESRVVPQKGYPLHLISIRGFKRGSVLQNVVNMLRLFYSMMYSFILLFKLKPDLCVGTGSYVSGPVVYAAALLNIPTCIQEQNSYPGMTTRLLAHKVDRVFAAYEEVRTYLKRESNILVYGNPVRHLKQNVDRTKARTWFSLSSARPLLLVFGGSQGARMINNTLLEMLGRLLNQTDIQILWSTGTADWQTVKTGIGHTQQRIRIFPYIDDMDKAYAAADLALCRAGALTLSELAVCGLPAVLVPLKIAAENHQAFNARVFEKAGAAVLIPEQKLSAETLYDRITQLLSDTKRLQKMSAAMKAQACPKAAQRIVDSILELL